jgi:hypothetical protein
MPLVVPPELRTRWITVGDDPEKLLADVRRTEAPPLGDREKKKQ